MKVFGIFVVLLSYCASIVLFCKGESLDATYLILCSILLYLIFRKHIEQQ